MPHPVLGPRVIAHKNSILQIGADSNNKSSILSIITIDVIHRENVNRIRHDDVLHFGLTQFNLINSCDSSRERLTRS